MDDGALLQYYRRELAKLRPIAEEIQDVLDVCGGKVGKTISEEDFKKALLQARQRGLRRAGLTTDEHEVPTLSEPK